MTYSLLVSMDKNYLPRLRTMLFSLFLNHPGLSCQVYFLHSSVPQESIDLLRKDMSKLGFGLTELHMDDKAFQNAPVTDRYPREMYYRLLAVHLLFPELERVLYLDPDILIINSLDSLWNLNMQGHMFAAASHNAGDELVTGINQIRLDTNSEYFNSGVLLMDLHRCRRDIRAEDIFSFVEKHKDTMILPDQDVLNALYGDAIYPLDDLLWNYDARKYRYNLVRSSGVATGTWVIDHTSVLHFCGSAKPWKENYPYRFGILYRHYMQLERRFFSSDF